MSIPRPTSHHTLASLRELIDALEAGDPVAAADYTPGDIEAWCQAHALVGALGGCGEPSALLASEPLLTPRAAVVLDAVVRGVRAPDEGTYARLAWDGALTDLRALGRVAVHAHGWIEVLGE